ncbi:MAG: 3-isopropylmalate dehydratase large subunit [Anaerolineae bacterium]|jgi:3-isopropylmalate/(R)-2-methylmalate dehydratase large subunit|nr:3-isopropylmalate dehydratase large subunit [Anaerolineae bacterium]MDH7473779.1 3-isopropylmalate dehydratase large subunit [Anaerolineae bacterium]
MGMTLAEKILAAHAGLEEVHPGQFVEVVVDVVLSNDITAPIAIREFEELGVERVFDPQRVVMVADHFAPNKDIKSAAQCLQVRQFARAQGLPHHFDVGRMGIEHVLLPEQGLVLPGDVVVGADSHTCTYGALGAFATGMGSTDIAVAMATGRVWMRVPETMRIIYHGELQPWVGGKDLILYTIGRIGVSGALYQAMEFAGPAVEGLSMAGRFTMANMAIEAGAKAGLFAVDEVTRAYVDGRATRPYRVYQADADAACAQVIEIDVSQIEPQVAFPHLPENTRPVSQANGLPIDQVVIGSCTNGRLEDLRVAAQVLRGRRVHPDVRCIIIPGSQQVYLDALREGLVEVFIEAGAAVSTPTCGPCLGGHMGVLAAGERAVSTTNRNFRGRMGHPESEVYLAGPAVAAASAVAGRIVHPCDL